MSRPKMSSLRWFALIGALLAGALVVSAALYRRTQSADYGQHAEAVQAVGNVRTLSQLLSGQVLAARFGLLNQYDSLTETELALTDAGGELRTQLGRVVAVDGELDTALSELDHSIVTQRSNVEQFKTANSVLKNSVYYLPTAAREVESALSLPVASTPAQKPQRKTDDTSIAVHRLAQAALIYNLLGDRLAREEHLSALAGLKTKRDSVPSSVRSDFDGLLAHATVIGERQPAVDGRVKEVVQSDIATRLKAVEGIYQTRFDAAVATSNQYRQFLYGWSILLVLAVCGSGIQLARLYAGLERRVALRTAELREALDALWGEMKLARKIQEALVPRNPSGADCEIAASMKPTDEVGGDYYDVIRIKEREWILIGDVSGHGVPAGLIMMMCHTAVRAVLRGDPDIMPDGLLARVNTVLTENVHQLGEDKYMTITAFRRERDGTMHFAGAHQDIHVYRAETDSIETFESEGIWLGLKEEIAHSLKTKHLRLGPGDLCLLYTDGITEAKRAGTMFDVNGVKDVLKRARGKSAEQVLSDLFSALDGFTLTDDATAIVLRQLDGNQPRVGT